MFSLLICTHEKLSTPGGFRCCRLGLSADLACRGCGNGPSATKQNKFLFLWTVIKACMGVLCMYKVCFQPRASISISYKLRSSLQPPAKLAQSLPGSEFEDLRGLGKCYSSAGLTYSFCSYDFSLGSFRVGGPTFSRKRLFPGPSPACFTVEPRERI